VDISIAESPLPTVHLNERDLLNMPINLLFVRYVMASYLYYQMDSQTPWSDSDYDYACSKLKDEWDTITHQHKVYTSLDSLRAGTGYDFRLYPTIAKVCAFTWLDEWLKSTGGWVK